MTSLGRRLIKAAREGVAIVRRKRRRRYTMEQLIEGITEENWHPEIDWGPPRGREVIEEYVDKSHPPSKK